MISQSNLFGMLKAHGTDGSALVAEPDLTHGKGGFRSFSELATGQPDACHRAAKYSGKRLVVIDFPCHQQPARLP